MKKCQRILVATIFCILICFLYKSYTPIAKNTHFIHRATLSNQSLENRVIPKLIHHTWITEDIPSKWLYSYNECKQKYPDYEFQLWTDTKSIEFIAKEYPEFLKTFDGYEHAIQRADAIRYFILYEHGGIYMDLDIGCADISLDNLLTYEAVIPQTKPFGYSNDMLASKPKHRFFKKLVEQLPRWNHWYIFPYLTVFCSTGPLFLSIQHYYYQNSDKVWILDLELYSDGASKIFKHYEGSTWHSWDAWIVKAVWAYSREIGFLIVFAIGLFLRLKRIGQFTATRRIKINTFVD